MKSVFFKTPTLLSHLDLFSMGGSDKADDDSTIGKYNSGLCFSMALALRNNVNMSVKVFHQEAFGEDRERDCETTYTFGTYQEYCEQTGKEKELIQITKQISKQSFFSVHCEDLEGGDYDPEIIPTGFSAKLGIDWSLYMLLREIYSNMIDENGEYFEDEVSRPKYGTIFKLEFEEDSEFGEIWNNRHLYINEKEALFEVSSTVKALENKEGYLKIYKQNILVYEDKEVESLYSWGITFGDIDEKRVLSNVYSVGCNIVNAIMQTKNEEFLKTIILPEFNCHKHFLYNQSTYYNASDLIHDLACEVYEVFGVVESYPWLINAVKDRKDCGIGGKRIKTVQDSLYNYSTEVTVNTNPEPHAEPSIEVEDVTYITPFETEINKYFKFKLDVEVRKASLTGSKVVADKYNKCLIIDNDFSVENDFPEFVVQYIDLTQTGNVITNLSKYICNLIKK